MHDQWHVYANPRRAQSVSPGEATAEHLRLLLGDLVFGDEDLGLGHRAGPDVGKFGFEPLAFNSEYQSFAAIFREQRLIYGAFVGDRKRHFPVTGALTNVSVVSPFHVRAGFFDLFRIGRIPARKERTRLTANTFTAEVVQFEDEIGVLDGGHVGAPGVDCRA
jgi:hypothetical protein